MLISGARSAALQAAIRAAVTGIAAGSAGALSVVGSPIVLLGLTVAILTINSHSNSESIDKDLDLSLNIPLSDLTILEGVDLQAIGESEGFIDLPFTLVPDTHGSETRLSVVKTDGVAVPSTAKVHLAKFDDARNIYTVSIEVSGRNFLFNPAHTPAQELPSNTSAPAVPTATLDYRGVALTPLQPDAYESPIVNLADLSQIVIGFPAESGLAPLLLVFKKREGPRYQSGVASGKGGDVSGIWLGANASAEGSVVPKSVASTLVGKDFTSFGSFRRSFWKAVSRDEVLQTQFSPQNLALMSKGKAPRVRQRDVHLSKDKYEIHHTIEIQNGGGVYDIDNLRIITPKAHQAIHGGTTQ